jgi:succinate dehydrogenase flavin-adding protein (antitoxin of CptAB toxin-antitoxin module)
MHALRSIALVLAAVFAVSTGVGCATVGDEARLREEAIQHSEQRLFQRQRELERARGDLVHFQTTRRHMTDHYSRWGLRGYDRILARFVDERVDPLLANEWQSSHPELARLDADLRLLRVEAQIDMRSRWAARRSLRDIARRYKGQEQMLVSHRPGQRITLAEGLAILELELQSL